MVPVSEGEPKVIDLSDPTTKMIGLLVGLPALALVSSLLFFGGEPAPVERQQPKVEARVPQDKPAKGRSASSWRAVDGDTIESPAGVNYRLVGLDTPEITQAKSPREKAMGEAAKARLQELLGSGEARLEPVTDRGRDRYGRELGRLYIGGEDVADIMIREGHARAYDGKGKRQPW